MIELRLMFTHGHILNLTYSLLLPVLSLKYIEE